MEMLNNDMKRPTNDMEIELANTYCHVTFTSFMTVTNHKN